MHNPMIMPSVIEIHNIFMRIIMHMAVHVIVQMIIL